MVNRLERLDRGLNEVAELLTLAGEEGDEAAVVEMVRDLDGYGRVVADLEFQRMFSGELDASNAFLDIQAGSGGTEAQDWAEMLLRMYLRWGERRGFKTELLEVSPGKWRGSRAPASVSRAATLWLAADRDRCPSIGAQVAIRFRQSPPHLVRGGIRVAGNRRQHRSGHQSG